MLDPASPADKSGSIHYISRNTFTIFAMVFHDPQQRRERGRQHRRQVRRQDHAHWRPEARRHNPLALMEASMRGRVPSLIALKYERMTASPFGFFRGAVPVMAADLSLLPHTSILNQICGDAHVRNLGAYAAPDGRLVFDINDFDETIRGPFEWDLKRLATSLVLAGREVGDKRAVCEEAVDRFVSQYRKYIDMFARMPVLEMVRFQVHRLQRITPVSSALLKAERATPIHTLEQLTVPAKGRAGEDGKRIFRQDPPLLTRLSSAQARAVLASLHEYRQTLLPERRHFFAQYRPVDVGFKVVGTGSVGLRDYLVFMEGNGSGDPLFLQIKEEPVSAYAEYLEYHGPHHQGQRVAEGQRAMQFQSDPFLGWTTIGHRHFLVRQLNDHKASIEIEDLKGQGLLEYAEMCGELLARGHSRSGDPCLIAGYLGNGKRFAEAILKFAEAYADQTEQDWEALRRSRRLAKKK
ncbi:DUF2252 domain-containing protein [Pseudacidobacterium ailaaui]|uniref:DUF2252 domain-containing protein n=1 Tax=Pseudacidobacterium ailaaui TaxID=1382359 RepID=UPI001EE37EAD|nr:DUF2252 domain-containing protein [Pseudacidobacterium ailaaui]